ncbi:hypothetical protein B0H13DRAFT_2574461 [Mycena leptocephala]|nr:hypothetical protein B0H13DRAFT_2574461 [Mycena leptocephala]
MEQPRSPTRHRRRSGSSTAHRTPTGANPIFPTALVSSIARPAPLLTDSARYSDSLDAPAASPTRPPARGFLALRGAAVQAPLRAWSTATQAQSSRTVLAPPFPVLRLSSGPSPLVFDVRSAPATPLSASTLLPLSFHIHLNLPNFVHATLQCLRPGHRCACVNDLILASPFCDRSRLFSDSHDFAIQPPRAADPHFRQQERVIEPRRSSAASLPIGLPRTCCIALAYDMRCDYQQRRLLVWTLYRTRTSRATHSTITYSPNVLRDCGVVALTLYHTHTLAHHSPNQCHHPHAQYATLAFLATHVISVASPSTTSVSSALPPAARSPRPPRTANRMRSACPSPPSSPVPPLSLHAR